MGGRVEGRSQAKPSRTSDCTAGKRKLVCLVPRPQGRLSNHQWIAGYCSKQRSSNGLIITSAELFFHSVPAFVFAHQQFQ